MKTIWNALGDIRVAFVLLMTASATLFTGALYAGGNFSLFHELNRRRIQDWLPGQLSSQPDVVWWIPLLFLIMGMLGVNTFICATSRMVRLIRQRRTMATGRFIYLMMPSLVHLLFIMIMIGHLTTFTAGQWQTLPLATGKAVAIDSVGAPYRVQSVKDRFFPETSGLRDRIAQTTVTLVDADQEVTQLQYARPAHLDGYFFLLDKDTPKKNKSKKERILPSTTEETCNKAHVYVQTNQDRKQGGQLLLIVSDPGLFVIITGLTLIMVLMIGYFLIRPKSSGL
jgi:hypothetical protein